MNVPNPIDTFRIEAADLLDQIEESALALEQRTDDPEIVNRLFRAFHTLKGSGAMFGFTTLAEFTHEVESVLEHARAGTRTIDEALLALILAARDEIRTLLDLPGDHALTAECQRIMRELAVEAARPEVRAPADARPALPRDATAAWQIVFRPPPSIAATGLDPAVLLDELRSLGPCTVEVDCSRLPPLAQLVPEQCHLAWRIALTTDRGLNAIRDVFIFVEAESELSIVPAGAASAAAPADERAPATAPEAASPASAAVARRTASAADTTVRVPAAKLDRLVNLVGELVMNQSRLAQVSARIQDPLLAGPVEAIERLSAELRESVLGIRMMPIGSTFSRFKRLVFDLSRELGKEIALVTDGAETELDKTVLNQLGDPLVHLIRNSIDHGICPPDERERRGKPRRGTIRLSAVHAGAHVVISIQDDGRGLDLEAIRTKAIEKGLIAADATLAEKEIFNLIFLPGFSTAREITSVSGRGVGMDVVKRQIDALRGSIQLSSVRGVGTTISLTLPLTLAIIDGLLIELAGDQYLLPMAAVTETVELRREARQQHNGRNAVAVRGELIPYVRLRDLFAVGGAEPELEKIVIVRHDEQRVGIGVDLVVGTHQTVIQPLGGFYRHIEVCSGSTIMGDGRVALILDLGGVLRLASRRAEAALHSLAA